MTYTVLGTGAVGGYYGAKLQKGGLEVNFLARSDYDFISQKGLTIDSTEGDFHLEEVKVFSSASELPPSDVVLISMKTTSNCILKELLTPIVKEGTILLVLQNGYGMEGELKELFSQARIMGGMCFICAEKVGPGHIAHLDKGHIALSPMNEPDSPLLQEIQRDFSAGGVETRIVDSLEEARWSKLLWNIPFNGLSVVLNANTRQILENEAGYNLAKKLMLEVTQGAEACGVTLDRESIDKMLQYTKVMIPYEPSMLVDFKNKRPLEVEYLYRKPLEAAKKRGVDLPSTAMLADQLDFLSVD